MKTSIKKQSKIIRTDKWEMDPELDQHSLLLASETEYRALVRTLIGVIYVHWPTISPQEDHCKAVEALMHPTEKRKSVKYEYFSKRFYKFPSYLRRAAIMFAVGQVSSFVTRYTKWQSGIRSRRDANPPRLNGVTQANMSLYKGQCIKYNDDFSACDIKVFNGSDWVWTTIPILTKRNRHKIANAKQKSAFIILGEKRVELAVPFELPRLKSMVETDGTPVCSVDLGINTTVVASIMYPDGTVKARVFIHPAGDIDRRDKGLSVIRRKAKQTGKLSSGFCRRLYRKGRNRNKDIANKVARQLVEFATLYGAHGFAFEYLKSFRPRGGKKKSTLRQRFHGWLHRKLVDRVKELAEEFYMSVGFVNPRGTSSYAYDGSGKVSRDKENHALCTFKTGKQYNCDLNASYNIGARYWIRRLFGGKLKQLAAGKSSSPRTRTPLTLSTLWSLAERDTTFRASA